MTLYGNMKIVSLSRDSRSD